MKTKTRFLRLVVAAAALVTVPALADAPSDQYAEFTEADTTIHDQKTLLTWQRTAGAPALHGVAEANCLTANERLPTVKELLTLVDEIPHKEYQQGQTVDLYADQQAFGGIDAQQAVITPVDVPYWTQTPGPASKPGQFWTVDFQSGQTALANGNATQLYVRCVSP